MEPLLLERQVRTQYNLLSVKYQISWFSVTCRKQNVHIKHVFLHWLLILQLTKLVKQKKILVWVFLLLPSLLEVLFDIGSCWDSMGMMKNCFSKFLVAASDTSSDMLTNFQAPGSRFQVVLSSLFFLYFFALTYFSCLSCETGFSSLRPQIWTFIKLVKISCEHECNKLCLFKVSGYSYPCCLSYYMQSFNSRKAQWDNDPKWLCIQ